MSRLALTVLLAFPLCVALSACGDGGLVGTWEPAGASGAGGVGSRTTFFADGSARIVTRTPGAEDEAYDARYTVSGDTLLTLSATGIASERFQLRLVGDTLMLATAETRDRTVLVRVGR